MNLFTASVSLIMFYPTDRISSSGRKLLKNINYADQLRGQLVLWFRRKLSPNNSLV